MVAIGGEMRENQSTVVQVIFVWFLRLMAVVALFSGLSYWAQLTGLGAAELPRFDQLPVHWQVPWVVLAVLLPCASMGLWMLTSWGIVLWVVAGTIEISVYGVWSDSYISRPAVVFGHMAALLVFALILAGMTVQRYRQNGH